MIEVKYNFQWDVNKARLNETKHSVSFRQACYVFNDPLVLTLFDEEHSLDGERWITLGQIPEGKHLLVVHTFEQQGDEVDIRIRLNSCFRDI